MSVYCLRADSENRVMASPPGWLVLLWFAYFFWGSVVLGIVGICMDRLFWGTKCSRIFCNLFDWLTSIYHISVVGKDSLKDITYISCGKVRVINNRQIVNVYLLAANLSSKSSTA